VGTIDFEVLGSLDGFAAGPDFGVDNPLGDDGELLNEWTFAGRTEAESRAYEEQVLATVIGRIMADVGIGPWGDKPDLPHACVRCYAPPARADRRRHDFHVRHRRVGQGAGAGADDRRGQGPGVRRRGHRASVPTAGVIDEMRMLPVPVLLGVGDRLFDGTVRPRADDDLCRAGRRSRIPRYCVHR
jgi:hypothetical protein